MEPGGTSSSSMGDDAAVRTEVVQRDHRPAGLLPAHVGQDRAVGLLENLDCRPADLRLLAVGVDEVAHEPPEGAVIAALVGGVDALRTVQSLGKRAGEPPLRRPGEAAVGAARPLHRRAHGESCLGCRGSRPSRSPRRRTGPEFPAARRPASRPSSCAARRRRAWTGAAAEARGRRAACPGRGRTRRRPPGARRRSACRG